MCRAGPCVEYYIIPIEPVHTVAPTVGAYKWYLRDFRRDGETFSFLSSDLTRQDAERRLQPSRLTRVVRSVGPAVAVRPLVNQFGAYALDFSYEVTKPRTYERTLVARLEVTEALGGTSVQP